VTVVAAGVTPITDGDVATFVFKADSKNPSVKVDAEVLLNENNSQQLSAVVAAIPSEFALKQNYPNPFNPTTTIKYQLPQDSKVTLTIYNTLGQVVRTLVNEDAKAGYYQMQWDGRNDAGTSVSTGMYIYRISAGNFTAVKKMTLMK
jgi:flagellar hook assembly protein FlgD